MKLIEMNLQRIFDLCRQYRIKTLSVFGSILTDRFNETSDVDLLVDFEKGAPDSFDYVSNYFGLRDALESIFNRKVDLIEYGDNWKRRVCLTPSGTGDLTPSGIIRLTP